MRLEAACVIIDEQVARGGGILRAQKRVAHGFVGKAFGQVRQNFQMFAGGRFGHEQYEDQRHGFVVGRIEIHGFFQAYEHAAGSLHIGMAAVRHGHAVSQAGRAQTFAGNQAVEHVRLRQSDLLVQQFRHLFKEAFLAAGFHVQHHAGQGEDFADGFHKSVYICKWIGRGF